MIGHPRGRALLLGGAVAVVLLAIGAALLVLDSPAEMRRQRLDDRRVRDLHHLEQAVWTYWRREDELPPDREALESWWAPQELARDPVTGEPYGYRRTGATTYELCATFTGETAEPATARGAALSLWHHPAGEHCFEREMEAEED